MSHVLLRRTGHGDVEAVETDDADEPAGHDGHDGRDGHRTTRVAEAGLAAFVRDRERSRPRWTWDDTAHWYPGLLAAGVRVSRCSDLRLSHAVLRGSPFATGTSEPDDGPGDAEAARRWRPAASTVAEPDLFDGVDPGGEPDVVAEHHRQRAVVAASPERAQLSLLLAAESTGALVAAEMTHAGLPWRADVHLRLLEAVLGPRPAPGHRPPALDRLVAQVQDALSSPGLNPDSAPALVQALRAAGLDVTDTRAGTLEHLDHPVVAPLLQYKKLARLLSTNGWHWLDTWVADGRFRPEYQPGGVVTGRWSSAGGGALMVPAPLRAAVLADDEHLLVVADAAQLEPRVLAGMAGDGAMAQAARATDLYEAMVASGAVQTRSQAKLGMLGAMYGATAGDSSRMVARLSARYPTAFGLLEAAARAGEHGEVVHTLLGRGSPRPSGAWTRQAGEDDVHDPAADRQRRSWGRFTRNFVVQGTAAEWALCWLALLRARLWQLGTGSLTERPHLVLFLHDEVVVHTPAELADQVSEAVRASAGEAGRLLFGDFGVDFPLQVSAVRSWADAG